MIHFFKKFHKKIIAYGFIIIGLLFAVILLIRHSSIIYYWYSAFSIIVGLTLLPLSGDSKK